MSVPPARRLPEGHDLFVRYAFPPNELGYCGPADSGALLRARDPAAIAAYAREFDGTWPYLRCLADAAGIDDPLDAEVVRGYWVGGPLLSRLDPAVLLPVLRDAFAGQVTGLLADLADPTGVPAHHSFHVFVVYPWIRFLDRAAPTALQVMQNCRIRWGTVESVDHEHIVMASRPLLLERGELSLGPAVAERVRWRRVALSLTTAPRPGQLVTAHWDWVCDTLTEADGAALADATQATLAIVNTFRRGT